MKLWIFSAFLAVAALLVPGRAQGLEKLKPSVGIVQVAGNMGLVSVGLGWNYGNHSQWETAMLYGYIPKEEGKKRYATFTLKQTYIPWSRPVGRNVIFEPITCGMYVNTILSRDFWIREPSKYPTRYYGFSTKMRFNIFVGESISYKDGTFFWEFGAADIYVVSKATNRYLKFWDIFGLSFGVKLRLD